MTNRDEIALKTLQQWNAMWRPYWEEKQVTRQLPFGTAKYKLVRPDDPPTSHGAAGSISTSGLERKVLAQILKGGASGVISDDVRAALPDLAYSSVTARYRALEEKSLIYYAGDKRPGRSGRAQRVMRARDYVEE